MSYLDEEGYPTDECIELVKSWNPKDGVGLLEFVESVWCWDNYISHEGNTWALHTGGWSGNEDLIGAMAENTVWWLMHWVSSERGGKFVFEVRQ